MSLITPSLRRISGGALRSLFAAGIVLGIVTLQSTGVPPLDRTRSPRNFPLALPQASADDWPGEQGFDGTGHCALDRLPRQIGSAGTPTWEVSLPGAAAGSPCVWGDVVITPVIEREPGRIALAAVNRSDGKPLWQAELTTETIDAIAPGSDAMPACDGQSVFLAAAAQGRLVLHAVDLQGRQRWQRDVGPMNVESGRLVSPLLHKNLVLVSGEHPGSRWNLGASTAHLTGVHRLTGEILWRIRRPNNNSQAKLALVHTGGRDQLIIPASGTIASYSPEDGSLLWTCRWTGQRSTNAVAWNEHAIFATTRHPQSATIAIRADGSGDVTDTHVLWQTSAAGSSLLTPRHADGSVLCLQEHGALISLDAGSGKIQWRKQLSGTFATQPLIAAGEFCGFDSHGRVALIDVTQRGKTLAEWTLGKAVVGQPIATRRQLLLRTRSSLISLTPDDGESPLVNSPDGTTNRL